MATATFRPNGDNSVAQSRSTGSNNYALVDESVEDTTDYTYVTSTFGNPDSRTDMYSFPDHTTETGTISNVTFYARAARIDATGTGQLGKITLRYTQGGTTYEASAQNLTTSNATYSWSQNTNQKTGAAWTWTDIDNMIAGDTLYCLAGTGKEDLSYSRKYQYYFIVTYTPAGWSHITKINGVASANISKVNGVAVANIAKVNGIAV